MASLQITRDSGWVDQFRAYQVIVDGKRVGKIRNGESKEFQVAPGQHTVALRIDLIWGSEPLRITVRDGEALSLHAKSMMRGGAAPLWAWWYLLIAPRSWLQLART